MQYAIKYSGHSSPLFMGLNELMDTDVASFAELEIQIGGELVAMVDSESAPVQLGATSLLDELNSLDQMAMA